MLAGAIPLHIGIGACLGMWTFGLIMLVGCASFLPEEAVRRLVEAMTPVRRKSKPAMMPLSAITTPVSYSPARIEVGEPVLVSDRGR